MVERLDATYHDPPVWPLPGESWQTGDLATLAVEWICTNRRFVVSIVGDGGDGWDANDVISRLAWRALHGAGLTRSLRSHVDGINLIVMSGKLFRYHVHQMIKEHVKEAALRRAHETPTDRLPDHSGHLVDSSDANVDGYLQLIEMLTTDILVGLEDASTRAVQHIQSQITDIWKIFSQFAPACVVQELSTWPEDDLHLVLLAVFPLQVPHKALARYRSLASANGMRPATESATQRKVSRLRYKLQQIWPPELAPSAINDERPRSHPDGMGAPQ